VYPCPVDAVVLDAGGAPTDGPVTRAEPGARFGTTARTRYLAVFAVLGLWSAALATVFWPGQGDPDTSSALQDVASGHYLDWHAPMLEVLWRGLYLTGVHGRGPVLFASVFTLVTGFYLVLRVRFGQLGSCIGAVLCSVFPPVLGWEAHVGTDAWFAALLLAGFGCAARAARITGRSRTVSLIAASVLGFLGLAARHNAFPAVVVLLAVVAALWLPPAWRRRRVWAVGLGIGATVVMMGVQAGILVAVDTRSMHAAQNTMLYDLTTLSKREGTMLLPKVADPGQNLSLIVRGTTVEGDEQLIYAPGAPIRWPLEGADYRTLTHSWESAILHHPYGYLSDRLQSGLQLLGVTHPEFWLFQEPGPDMAPKFPALNRPALSYLSATTQSGNNLYGSVLYDAWIYVLILAAASVVLWRRTRADRVLALLAAAVLVYTLVTIFAVPEMLYRYVYVDVVAGIVLLPVLWPRRKAAAPGHRIRGASDGDRSRG